jgi:hypothetical protein
MQLRRAVATEAFNAHTLLDGASFVVQRPSTAMGKGEAQGGQIELVNELAQETGGVISPPPTLPRRGERNCWP